MKMRVPIIVAASVLFVGCGQVGITELHFGDKVLCLPSDYAPDVSFLVRFIAPAGVESDELAQVRIPAVKVKETITSYTLSHASKRNPSIPNEISGVVSAPPYAPDLGPETWAEARENPAFVVKKDSATGYWRIYDRNFPESWRFVKSAPPIQSPPLGWFIGLCSGTPEDYECLHRLEMDGFAFDYSLHKSNVKLHDQIQTMLRTQFTQWQRACQV